MQLDLIPTSVVNDNSYGNVPWTNPDGFRRKYYGEATAVLNPTDTTNYAKAAFDCSTLPVGVTLTGIKLEWKVGNVWRDTSLGAPGDASIKLEAGGDDKARPTQGWAVAPVWRAYGGDGDLWNSGLDADAVRANGLVALLAAKWRINPQPENGPDGTALPKGDEIKLTLYYV